MRRSTGHCAALLSVAVALSSLAACDFEGNDKAVERAGGE
jgi:hypothetical protein